jgi:hypothetical protein
LSHLFDGARRGYIGVHHNGGCGSEGDAADKDCWSRISCGTYNHFYDFCVSRNGTIATSWDTACLSYPFYRNATGGATCGANCVPNPTFGGLTAVMMQRCYGGNGCSCPLAGFTDPQLCALAYLSYHLGAGTWNGQTPSLGNHISHFKAGSWNPCGGGCFTECCGLNLAGPTPSGWTAEGEYEMNRMLWMRSNLAAGCSCTGLC